MWQFSIFKPYLLKLKKPIFILLVLLVKLSVQLNAQNQDIIIGGQWGKVLKIYSDFPESSQGYGIDIAWTRQGDTNNIWEGLYDYPETGIVLTYTNFGNSDTLGSSIGLVYRFQLMQMLGKRWSITEGMDMGFAYYNKPFHNIENPGNIAVGGSFSALIRFNFSIRYAIANSWQLYTGFTFHHASNGHTGLPNVGINIPMLNFGLVYYLKKDDSFYNVPKPQFECNKKVQFNMRFAMGINRFGSEVGPSNGPYYPIYLASFYLDKRVSGINKLQFGIDTYYNSGYRQYLESQQPKELEANFVNSSVISIWIGNELLIGRMGIILQVGYYLHNPFLKYFIKQDETADQLKAYIPGRFGVQYYLKDHFHGARSNAFIGVYVKSNMGQADFLEFSLGVKF